MTFSPDRVTYSRVDSFHVKVEELNQDSFIDIADELEVTVGIAGVVAGGVWSSQGTLPGHATAELECTRACW